MERHRPSARGHAANFRPDGLVVPKPRRIRFHLSLRGFVLLIGFFAFFKGFMLASLGAATYGERLDMMGSGTLYERAGAVVMGIDPVSQAIADLLLSLS